MSAARNVPPGALLPHTSVEQLRLYALGVLGPADRLRVEAHLPVCPACRAVLGVRQSEVVRAVEALPVPEFLPTLHAPPPRPAPTARGWPRTAQAAVAALALLTVTGLGWNLQQAAIQKSGQLERQEVTAWLARPDVRLVTLSDLHQRPSGRVLISADGEALFVLPDAPPSLEYRAWVARDWHPGQPMTLAHESPRGTFTVSLGRNDYLCLSLERPGAPRTGPARSQILGKAFL